MIDRSREQGAGSVEVAKDWQKLCRFVANGNPHAEQFSTALLYYLHLLDDLHDKDVPVSAEEISQAACGFLHETVMNPFFMANRERLVALIEMAFNAWTDSEQPGCAGRLVIKSLYHEVVFHVARLTGGWQHYRQTTMAFREYDFETERKVA